MIKNKIVSIVLPLLLAFSVPSFAQKHPHGKAAKGHSDPVAAAKKDYEDATHKCARARTAYESYHFSGGSHEEKQTHSLTVAKDSACNAAASAHTKYGNALHAAGKTDPSYTPKRVKR